jgi:hypothetical protein
MMPTAALELSWPQAGVLVGSLRRLGAAAAPALDFFLDLGEWVTLQQHGRSRTAVTLTAAAAAAATQHQQAGPAFLVSEAWAAGLEVGCLSCLPNSSSRWGLTTTLSCPQPPAAPVAAWEVAVLLSNG